MFLQGTKVSTYRNYMWTGQPYNTHTRAHTRRTKSEMLFAPSARKQSYRRRCCVLSGSPRTAVAKSRCLKQTLLCLHFINSLNSRVSLNYSCFKSIRRPHCSILFERSAPKITMCLLAIVGTAAHIHPSACHSSPARRCNSFNGRQAKLHLLILQ